MLCALHIFLHHVSLAH